MVLDATTPVFFDASSLVTAAGSASGGSSYLLALCERGMLTGIVSHAVLREAARNIQAKLPPPALERFAEILAHTRLQVIDVTSASQQRFSGLVNSKDAHVLAGAMLAGAPYLITLDRSLADEVNRAGVGVRALTPGDFIRQILPQHPAHTEPGSQA